MSCRVFGIDLVAISPATATTVPTAAATAAEAATASTTTKAAATAAATAKAAARRTILLWPGLVDGQSTTGKLIAVERLDRGVGRFLRLHLDETEATRTPSVAISDDIRRINLTRLTEQLLEILLRHAERKVAYVQTN